MLEGQIISPKEDEKSPQSNIYEDLFEQYINILYVHMSDANEYNSLKKATQSSQSTEV